MTTNYLRPARLVKLFTKAISQTTMVRRHNLISVEKSNIDLLYGENYSSRSICQKRDRRRSAISAHQRQKNSAESRKSLDQKEILSARDKRVIFKETREGRKQARDVWGRWKEKVSLHSVQRVLQEEDNCDFGPFMVWSKIEFNYLKQQYKFALK